MCFLNPFTNSSFLKKIIIFFYILLALTVMSLFNVRQKVIFYRELKHYHIISSNLEVRDTLPAAEDLNFSPGSDSIFFHETSCRGGLTKRQACSIESAARAHPRRRIYVLFSSPISQRILRNSYFATLRLHRNINFARVHIEEYARKTPLEEMVFGKAVYKSRWWVENTSNMLRLLTLYKYGGVYLDTDVLVAKSLTPLGGNWVGLEDTVNANTALLAISMDQVGRTLINALLNELKVTFKPKIYGYNGPKAITRVLHRLCDTHNVTKWSASTCGGFAVYTPEYFYPVPYTNCSVYFKPGDLANKEKNAYAYHFWNKLSRRMTIEQESPFMKLAEKLCPAVFQMYRENKSKYF